MNSQAPWRVTRQISWAVGVSTERFNGWPGVTYPAQFQESIEGFARDAYGFCVRVWTMSLEPSL